MLPTVMVPKNTVTYIARPRARTQSGSASAPRRSTKEESAAIQQIPATMLAAIAVTGSRARPNRTRAAAVRSRPRRPAGSPRLSTSAATARKLLQAPRRRSHPATLHRVGALRRSGSARRAEAEPSTRSRRKKPIDRASVARRWRLFLAYRNPVRIALMNRSAGSDRWALPISSTTQNQQHAEIADGIDPEWRRQSRCLR